MVVGGRAAVVRLRVALAARPLVLGPRAVGEGFAPDRAPVPFRPVLAKAVPGG